MRVLTATHRGSQGILAMDANRIIEKSQSASNKAQRILRIRLDFRASTNRTVRLDAR